MSSTKFVFFGPIGKTRWPSWPLIGWGIFDYSKTAEWNSTKLDRKEDLNVLYQVCVFRADQKNKMAALASDLLRHFRLLLWNRWTEFNETWQEARSQRPLPSICFRADLKNKMAALASDWLRHFRLLPWNRWTEFNETWQEAKSRKYRGIFEGHSLVKKTDKFGKRLVSTSRTYASPKGKGTGVRRSKRPLSSKISTSSTKIVFFGPIGKTNGRPGLWLAGTFSTSFLKQLNGIQRSLKGSNISTSSTKFVFFRLMSKQKFPPWLICQNAGTLYSGARYVALWASCFRETVPCRPVRARGVKSRMCPRYPKRVAKGD